MVALVLGELDELAGELIDSNETVRSLAGVGSGTKAKDRDPGHYRSAKDGGEHSFFGDFYRTKITGSESSAKRIAEHMRALDTGGEGVGIVPPKWLTDEFETLARQGRRIANAVRNVPLGDDPRPMTLPRQTAGTDAVVLEQTNENDPVDDTDAWDSDVHVVTPKPTAGAQIVSRQMIDMSTPAIDLLIYGDLMEAYDDKVEAKVGAAIVTAAGAAITTFATEAAFEASNGGAAYDAAIDLQIAIRQARKRPADLLWMNVRRYGVPKRIYVRWQSMAEPQTYRVILDIPERARQLMSERLDPPCRTSEYRHALALGLAPGGIVRGWVMSTCGKPIEVLRAQAEIEPKGPYRGESNGKHRPLSDSAKAYIEKHGIPYGSW